jgi:hypothetical protein
MRRPILNNSIPGDAVYEPFLGSGTTLIAAESTGRLCLAMELDPLYVDVAIRRWQAFTGKEAVLSSSGKTFGQVAEERAAGPPDGSPPLAGDRAAESAAVIQPTSGSEAEAPRRKRDALWTAEDTGSSSSDIANTQHLASLAVDSRPDAGEAPLPAGAATPLPSSPSTQEA